MIKSKSFSFILLLFNFCLPLFGVTVGSDVAVTFVSSLQNFSGTTNSVTGFALLDGGFSLADSSVACTYDSHFPITGSVFNLNAGTLTLNRDLKLKEPATMTLGNVIGNDHTLELASTITFLDCNLPSVAGALNFVDQDTETVNVRSIDWSYDNKYVAVGLDYSATFFYGLIKIFEFQNEELVEIASFSTPTKVNSVRWHPSSYILAACIDDTSEGSTFGNEVFTLNFNFAEESLTYVDGKTLPGVISIAWRPDGNYLAYAYGTAETNVGVSAILSGIFGDFDTVYIYSIPGQKETICWNNDGTRIFVANGQYVDISTFDGTNLVYTDNYRTFISTVYSLDYHPTSDYIAVGLDVGVVRLGIISFNPVTNSLTELLAKDVGASRVNGIHWNSDGNEIAVVQSTGILELKLYSFNAGIPSLTLLDDVLVSADVLGVRWSHDDNFIGIAVSNNVGSKIMIYQYGIASPSSYISDLCLKLNSNVELKKPLTCYGISCIDGQGYSLDLGVSGSLIISADSCLCLKNLNLINIAGTNIRGLDESSKLILSNAIVLVSNEATFSEGAIDIVQKNKITGDSKWTWLFNGSGKIYSNSELFLDANVTLSFAPLINSNQLLEMEDGTSVLSLNGGKFYVSNHGLQLTKGSLNINQTSDLISAGTWANNGIIFGNGIESDNLNINGKANLNIFGFLASQNVEI
ncbi:MAG: hypothetical protein UR26_C0006G0011 [candidate division TM6 bacterium GW2011_GWF2_32_72]|nr:MAG: hypothetical protein UR26_C0006G0011 [candidate division TM6 bacterium GW2011_GWF2_32_72]